MKKRTLSKLKSLFGSKKGKRQQLSEQSAKSSRSPSPEATGESCESYRPLVRTPPPSNDGPPPSPPVPTCPVAPVAPQPAGPLPLMPCPVCGRTFVPQSLAKHTKICEKMIVKKRKTFDSSRQRREGTDLEQYLPKNFGLPENSPFLEKSPPNTAKPAPKPKPQSVRSAVKKPMVNLQKCPHCARAFGVRAFERHVDWCANKAKLLPRAAAAQPPHIADAKQRLNARTQYKAPLARARKSSQTCEKVNSRSPSVDSSRGVSPPPPPRECGDYKQGRTRASESVSNNDCNEDGTHHVPVIRNSRTPQNHSGDVNVKARQARLARDLSSNRNTCDSKSSPVQQSSTDPNLSKQNFSNKVKHKINVKKKQQLKKLEEIANKYIERNERNTKTKNTASNPIDEDAKSHIPVLKKTSLRNKGKITTDKEEDIKGIIFEQPKRKPKMSKKHTSINKGKEELVKQPINNNLGINCSAKESRISLDSLDEVHDMNNKKSLSVAVNTELLCPCVPCKIYICPEQKKGEKRKPKSFTKVPNTPKTDEEVVSLPPVELLYRNPKMDSFDLQSKEISETLLESNKINPNSNNNSNQSLDLKTNLGTSMHNETTNLNKIKSDKDKKNCSSSLKNIPSEDNLNNLSAEEFDEHYEHDLSAEIFNDSLENEEQAQDDKDISRHGSGETYTKFSEDPADLEEFFKITDKIINKKTGEEKLDDDIAKLHTPNSNSIEALNNETKLENVDKHTFSNTLTELKSSLKEILQETTEVNVVGNIKDDDTKKNVHDMEHITVFELKFYEKEKIETESLENNKTEFKLPSILDTNNIMKRDQRQRNVSRPHKKIDKNNRNNTEYKTFIVDDDNSDSQSITSEAPPLKLPRIEVKRLDETYDPFVSAARQMKELMSSDTDIPKKIQTSPKELNKTLPALRQNKDLTFTPHLKNNTKTKKEDTLNKLYQKTPTLQRMKSFGSINNENKSSFGGRCSSFRMNRNDKKSTPKLNTTFIKSSKENVNLTDRSNFDRNGNLNKSFSNYSSNYNSPKLKDKVPKIGPSLYHSFQRTSIKQPLKVNNTKNDYDKKKDFVNLDSILSFDNTSMTDSNYIDPKLINENDNLPINVTTILNNPDIISSMESLLNTENLPAKFESFSINNKTITQTDSSTDNKINTNTASLNELNTQYEKFISSLEQSIHSKTSERDDQSLCEDFDLEEFMTSFDEEVNKQKTRTYSSTTRIVKSDVLNTDKKIISNGNGTPSKNNNGIIPVNKSMSLVFSSNNVKGENLFPSSVKRSNSLLDSIQKKHTPKMDNTKNRRKADLLEQDIMQSLKDFDKFYEADKIEDSQISKEFINYTKNVYHKTKKETRMKSEHTNKNEQISNGHFTASGKACNDSAYSSLNRISPSKLSLCNSKEPNGTEQTDRSRTASESLGSHKDEIRSVSSDEFLAMERSAEINEPGVDTQYKDLGSQTLSEKRTSSRASSQRTGLWQSQQELSSSGSESSLHRGKESTAPHRLSRFCHECGNKFPVDTAKFCIECGVKRLLV